MATGSTYAAVTEKRLFGTADFRDRLLGHLRELVQESYEKSFRGGCVYDTALSLISGGNDKISISGTSQATDGQGHLLDVATSGYATGLQFENTAAVEYEVGLHYAEVPNGVQVNPRTGLPEFIGYDEQIGESGTPDLVTDNGNGTITFRVNSVTESGVSNAGRKVQVWKNIPGPNATTEAVAVEELTVTWTGSNNEITTAAALGQDTVSTTAADYTVVLMGATVKRNTTLYDVDGYAFLGKVTGGGAGSPPSGYDITDQDVIDMSLSDLADITSRNATTDRLKIDVKSYTGDVSDPQIQVRNPAGTPVFTVDGNGNVVIEGTTTQEDFVQVNASETITDNLTAGDDGATDSHKIKGTWWHTNNAETANYFKVDGATGRVGIGTQYDTSGDWPLNIGYHTRINNVLRISTSFPTLQLRETDVAVDAGGLWRLVCNNGDIYLQENTAAGGNFSSAVQWLRLRQDWDAFAFGGHAYPAADNALDLGTASLEWRNLYIDGFATIDTLYISSTAGEGAATAIVPTTNVAFNLGSSSYRWATAFTERVDATIDTDSVSSYALLAKHDSTSVTNTRLAIARFDASSDATIADYFGGALEFYTNNVNIAKLQWWRRGADDQADLRFYLRDAADANTEQLRLNYDGGIYTRTILPFTNNTYDLGSAAFQWANLYVTTLNLGSNFLPAADLSYDLGSSSYRWLNLYTGFVRLQHGTPSISWRDTGEPVDDGGLFQIKLDGGSWIVQENTAAGGDFSTARNWFYISDAIYPNAHFIPAADDTWNLGHPTSQWGDLYIDGIAYVDTLNLSTTAGEGIGSHLTPTTTYTYDLGNASYRWRILYLSSQDGEGINAHLKPTSDDTLDLGSGSYQWRNLYLDGTALIDTLTLSITGGEGVGSSILPTTNITYNLGSGSYRWNNVYCEYVDSYTYTDTTTAQVFWWSHYAPTVTNELLKLGTYGAATDGTPADGLGWYVEYNVQYNTVARMEVERADADDTAHIYWSLWTGSAYEYQLALWYNGGMSTRTHWPWDNNQYDLGSSLFRWRLLYGVRLDIERTSDNAANQISIFRRKATTLTDVTMVVNSYTATTDATAVDGFGGKFYYYNLGNIVYVNAWKRRDADDQVDVIWTLRDAANAYVEQFKIKYDGGIETRTILPYATRTYDLGSNTYWWRDLYCETANAGMTSDTLTATPFWWYHWAETVTNQALRIGIYEVGTDATAADGLGGYLEYLLQTNKVATMDWVRRGADDQVDLYWYLNNASDTLEWQLKLKYDGGMDTRTILPAAPIIYNLGSNNYRWNVIYSTYIDGFRYDDTVDVRCFAFNHNAITVTASGLLVGNFNASTDATAADGFGGMIRHYNQGNNVVYYKWSRRDADTTADFIFYSWNGSTWITNMALYYEGVLGSRTHRPFTGDQYDLGDATYEWRDLYLDGVAYMDELVLSAAAFEGVGNHFVPNANSSWTLGNTSYYWSWLYVNRVFSSYTNNTQLNYNFAFERWTTTGTNVVYALGQYDARTTQTVADGFGGVLTYRLQTAIVTQYTWQRRDADDQVDLYWYLNDATDTMTWQLKVKYDGGIDTRTILPAATTTYNLGSSSYRWLNAYLAGATYFGTDLNFSLSLSSSNPFLALDSNDAFWYDRTANRFYFRIGSSDTITRIDATNATFGVHVLPYADETQNLGNGTTNRWNIAYCTYINASTTSSSLTAPAFKFVHNGDTETNDELLIGQFICDTDGTQADGFGGYIEYKSEAVVVAMNQWTRDGADDQYDWTWWVHNGTSLTKRMTFYWDDWVGILDHTQFFNTVYVFKDTISTGDLVKFEVPYTPSAVDGTLNALLVSGGTSSFPQKTRYLRGINVELYGCGHTTLNSIVFGIRTNVYRDLDENNDVIYGAYHYAEDIGTGGTGVEVYGIRSEGNDGAEAYGIYAYGHDATVNYGCYGIAQNGTNTYGLYGSGSGGSGNNYGLYVPTGTKTWVNPHPTDPAKAIVYSTVEADRDTALLRGRAQLVNGRAIIVFPEHYAMTVSDLPEEPVHVIVTPRSAESKGIAVVSSNNEGFEAVELAGGQGNYEFDYVVTGARRGYEEKETIIDNVDYIPGEGNLAGFEGDVQEHYDRQAPGLKRIFKTSGILDNQGKVNSALFAAKGWKTGKIKKDKEANDGQTT